MRKPRSARPKPDHAALLKLHDDLIDGEAVAGFGGGRLDRRGAAGAEDVLHLHRFHHRDRQAPQAACRPSSSTTILRSFTDRRRPAGTQCILAPKAGARAMQRTRILMSTIALAGAGLSLGGCATEDYVDKHIAVVSQRIDGLEARMQQV